MKLNIRRTAVHNGMVEYDKDGIYTAKKRSDRPRVITPYGDHIIRRTAVRSPRSSSKKNKGRCVLGRMKCKPGDRI